MSEVKDIPEKTLKKSLICGLRYGMSLPEVINRHKNIDDGPDALFE